MTHSYAGLRPDEIESALGRNSAVIVPWGALEWHGPHLPMGLDGLVAEAFSERLAERVSALLLPTLWLPVTTLPHDLSIHISAGRVLGHWEELLEEMVRIGAQVICSVSGHYAQAHEIAVMDVAEKVMERHPQARILTGTPLSLLEEPDLLDHAGRYETSQLLALQPELVRLEALGGGPLLPLRHNPVLGSDPRLGSADEGADLLERGLQAWAGWVERLRGPEPDLGALKALYERRRVTYQGYVRKYYRGSWDEAVQTWWREAIERG